MAVLVHCNKSALVDKLGALYTSMVELELDVIKPEILFLVFRELPNLIELLFKIHSDCNLRLGHLADGLNSVDEFLFITMARFVHDFHYKNRG